MWLFRWVQGNKSQDIQTPATSEETRSHEVTAPRSAHYKIQQTQLLLTPSSTVVNAHKDEIIRIKREGDRDEETYDVDTMSPAPAKRRRIGEPNHGNNSVQQQQTPKQQDLPKPWTPSTPKSIDSKNSGKSVTSQTPSSSHSTGRRLLQPLRAGLLESIEVDHAETAWHKRSGPNHTDIVGSDRSSPDRLSSTGESGRNETLQRSGSLDSVVSTAQDCKHAKWRSEQAMLLVILGNRDKYSLMPSEWATHLRGIPIPQSLFYIKEQSFSSRPRLYAHQPDKYEFLGKYSLRKLIRA
jgi:hypothetical protein